MGLAGWRGRAEGGVCLPQVEEHVGLLVQDRLDVAGMDQGVVHLVPLPVASLEPHRVWGRHSQTEGFRTLSERGDAPCC